MSFQLHKVAMVALLFGSAILLFSCKGKSNENEESLDAIKTEESENLTIIMSENGRKSYLFTTPLLEGYTLGRDPYREFRKGITITTYKDDSLTTENTKLVANYAIYYEKRKLWEAKGDVVVTKPDGTRLYTQQLFWNSITKRIYSNVDTKLVTNTDEIIGEGFESDEDMNEPRFRRWKGYMQVDPEQLKAEQNKEDEKETETKKETKKATKPTSKPVEKKQNEVEKPTKKAEPAKNSTTSTATTRTAPKSASNRPDNPFTKVDKRTPSKSNKPSNKGNNTQIQMRKQAPVKSPQKSE